MPKQTYTLSTYAEQENISMILFISILFLCCFHNSLNKFQHVQTMLNWMTGIHWFYFKKSLRIISTFTEHVYESFSSVQCSINYRNFKIENTIIFTAEKMKGTHLFPISLTIPTIFILSTKTWWEKGRKKERKNERTKE